MRNPVAICRFIHGWTEKVQCEELYRLAKDHPGNGITVEIGCYMGRSTVALAYGLQDRGFAENVHIVDPFIAPESDENLRKDMRQFLDPLGQFKKNMEAADVDNIRLFVGTSEAARKSGMFTTPIRLAFIDGDHSYRAVRHDLEWLVPLMEPGGVIALDDYGTYEANGWGVRRAATEALDGRKRRDWRIGDKGRAYFAEVSA